MVPPALRGKQALPELPPEYFWKSYKDPLTGKSFSAVAVKRSAHSVKSRDPDFGPRYEGINPLWYQVIVAPSGFAGEDALFKRSTQMLLRDPDALREHLEGLPPPRDFNVVRDLQMACEAYSLALSLVGHLRLARHEIASLALKTSWLYRDWADEGNESAARQVLTLRRMALEHYLVSYETEDISKLKIGGPGVGYLIAELLREQGKFDESLRWFSRIVTDKAIGTEVKRLARNQMDLCREQRSAARDSGEYERPQPQRMTERAVYQVYRDQAHWLNSQGEASGLSASEVLRALIDAAQLSGIDIGRFGSEQELMDWLTERLGK
jgi:uncharacterized protein (DUF2225 family)